MSADLWFGALTGFLVVSVLIMLVRYAIERDMSRRRLPQRLSSVVAHLDEKVLLGPTSAWVAEGEARAVRDWRQTHGPKAQLPHPDCDDCEWESLCVVERLEPITYIRTRLCAKHLNPPIREVEIR